MSIRRFLSAQTMHARRWLRVYPLCSLFLCPLLALLTTSLPAIAAPHPQRGPGWIRHVPAPVSLAGAREILAQDRQVDLSTAAANAAEITPLIQSVADALDRDPKRIYDYVYNYIAYEPTFGAANGATGTLLARRGNDWDQASLLVALLRAAGFTARYVEGDVLYAPEVASNWLGIATDLEIAFNHWLNRGVPVEFSTDLEGVTVFRVWVEAEINGQRVILDPALKKQTVVAPLATLLAGLNYNRDAFLARLSDGATLNANSVQNLNEVNLRADLATFTSNLPAHLESVAPTATLAELIGGAQIIQRRTDELPTTLPEAVVISNQSAPFDTIPANWHHTLRVQHAGIDKTFAIHEIAGKRLSITHDGADNAPILRLEGAQVAVGAARLQKPCTRDRKSAAQ